MNTRLFALVLAGTTSVLPALAQTGGATVKPIATTPAAPAPAPVASGAIAADVNGDKIYTADLNRIMDVIKATDKRLQDNTPDAQKVLADVRSQRLDALIEATLLTQEAKRQKITIATNLVEEGIARLRAWYLAPAETAHEPLPTLVALAVQNAFKSDDDSHKWMENKVNTPESIRTAIRNELANRELVKQLTLDITVSNDDIANYYKAHIDLFTVPEQVSARHILLSVNPKAAPADKEAVRKRALTLLAQLKVKGADFNAICKNNSDDTNASAGGDLGYFIRGMMPKPIEDAAFAAKEGDILGPIATDFGYHLVRVDKKIAAHPVPLAEVQKDSQVKFQVRLDKVQQRLDDTVAALKAKAKIQKF